MIKAYLRPWWYRTKTKFRELKSALKRFKKTSDTNGFKVGNFWE
jgi:hypothetical protein